jgi:DNA transformation protein
MSADLIAHLQDLASDFGALSARRMFGGYGVYQDGVMIGLISGDVLYLKTDDHTQERFRAADSGPFMYTRRGETVPTSYWSVPEAAMDSSQDMKPWLVLAYGAALRKANAAASKARPRKATSAKAKSAEAKATKVGVGERSVAQRKAAKAAAGKAKPAKATSTKPKPAKPKPAKPKPAKPDAKRR